MNDTRIDRLEVGFQTLDGKVDVLTAHVQELTADVQELKSDVSELKSDVSELKSDVSELKSDVSELKSDVSELKTDVRTLTSKVDSNAEGAAIAIDEQRRFSTALVDQLRTEMRQGFSSLERRFDRLEERLFNE